jgi:hypothetical protein
MAETTDALVLDLVVWIGREPMAAAPEPPITFARADTGAN